MEANLRDQIESLILDKQQGENVLKYASQKYDGIIQSLQHA